MSRTKSHSYRSKARSAWSKVEFTDPCTAPTQPTPCIICGGKVEESPLMRGVCYSCYSSLVSSPEAFAALKDKVNEQAAYAAMDEILGTEPVTQREMESMVELFMGGEK
jgi:reverse gyrase